MTIDFESATVPVEQASAPMKQRMFRLLNQYDLEQMPDPKWLIDKMILENSLAVLFGAPEAGKSFLALDAALCLATGQPFLGRPVETGHVVYVMGEAPWGIKARFQAWTRQRGIEAVPKFLFLNEPPQLLQSDQLDDLEGLLLDHDVRPKLIVLDTLARCFSGGDDSSAADMGKFVAAADKLRRRTGATILIVHHPNKHSKDERGSGALRGAADTMWLLARTKRTPTLLLKCDKQKDAEPFAPVDLLLTPAHESCVIEIAASRPVAHNPAKRTSRAASAKPEPCLEALKVVEGTAGATWSEWQSSSQTAESTFNHHRKRLLRNKLVVKDPESKRYSTVKGEPR